MILYVGCMAFLAGGFVGSLRVWDRWTDKGTNLLCQFGWHKLAPLSAWTHWEDEELPPYRWCTRRGCDHHEYTYGPVTVITTVHKL